MDKLGKDAKMRHITVDGVTVAGRVPDADPASWATVSGAFVVFACSQGHKK